MNFFEKRLCYKTPTRARTIVLQNGGSIQTEGGTNILTVSAAGVASVVAPIQGLTPSHVVVAAGRFTTAGGDASESITVTGVVDTDQVLVNLHTVGGTPRTILTAAAGTGSIAVTLSGDPSTDHVFSYVVLRAAA